MKTARVHTTRPRAVQTIPVTARGTTPPMIPSFISGLWKKKNGSNKITDHNHHHHQGHSSSGGTSTEFFLSEQQRANLKNSSQKLAQQQHSLGGGGVGLSSGYGSRGSKVAVAGRVPARQIGSRHRSSVTHPVSSTVGAGDFNSITGNPSPSGSHGSSSVSNTVCSSSGSSSADKRRNEYLQQQQQPQPSYQSINNKSNSNNSNVVSTGSSGYPYGSGTNKASPSSLLFPNSYDSSIERRESTAVFGGSNGGNGGNGGNVEIIGNVGRGGGSSSSIVGSSASGVYSNNNMTGVSNAAGSGLGSVGNYGLSRSNSGKGFGISSSNSGSVSTRFSRQYSTDVTSSSPDHTAFSSTAAAASVDSSSSGYSKQNNNSDAVDGKLCCDKCDGKHATENCPYYKKKRDDHPDAQRSAKKMGCTSLLPGSYIQNAKVARQPGDGSCLFHSMSYGLAQAGSTRTSASRLRSEICSFISGNPNLKICDTPLKDWIKWDSGRSCSEYARYMSGGSWGGGIEMASLAQLKGVNVHVYERYRSGFKRISAFDHPVNSESKPIVRVLYCGGVHYDALVCT